MWKGCSTEDIHQTLNSRSKSLSQQEKPTGMASVPYMQTTSNRIARVLARFSIKTVHVLTKKSAHLLKGNLGFRASGVHCIPCE
jgi:hypothetical protein